MNEISERSYFGVSASSGIASGELIWHPSFEEDISKARTEFEEKELFRLALEKGVTQLRKISANSDSNSAQFLEFQISILEDSVLLNAVENDLSNSISADVAWRKQMDRLIDYYHGLDDQYFRVRYEDFLDVRDRVLGILLGQQKNLQYNGKTIFIGNELMLSHFLEMDLSKVCGVALLRGSPASHVAILSRAKGIPYLVMLKASASEFKEKSDGIIDAEKGVLIQRPGNKVIQLYEQLTLTSSRPSKVKEKYHLKNVSSNNSVLLQTVINNLGQNIILGKYATGEKMPVEHELAASINVGRNILREAIKILSDKGLLSTGPRRGTLVQPRNNWNLLDKDVLSWMITCFDSSSKFLSDLNEFRYILEPSIAELAARRASEYQRLMLHQAMERLESVNKSPDKSIEAEVLFHSAIYEATNNEILFQLKFVTAALLHANHKILKGESSSNLLLYRRISEVIINKKPIEARKEMKEFLIKNKNDLKRVLSVHSKYL